MGQLIRLDEDWHICSDFPGDAAKREQAVHAAEVRGLKKICLVAKVRRHSDRVGEFVRACRALDRSSRVEVSSGIEAEVLDLNGALDLPPGSRSADRLYVCVRRLPTPLGPLELAEARERIASGALLPSRAIEWLFRASVNAGKRDGPVVLTQPLHVLSELGIEPRRVHPAYVRWLAASLAEQEVAAELCERRRGPARSVVRCFLKAGVTVLAASGSGDPDAVGRYEWCREVAAELADCGPRIESPEPIYSLI